MTPEAFVDATAVAQFLSITRRQVLELARAGKLPAHPLPGSRRNVWRFKLSEIDQLVSSSAKRPVSVSLLQNPEPASSSTIASGSPRSQKEQSHG